MKKPKPKKSRDEVVPVQGWGRKQLIRDLHKCLRPVKKGGERGI